MLAQTHPECTTKNVSFSVCSSDSTGKIDFPFMLPVFHLSLKKIGLPYADSSVHVEPYIKERLRDLAGLFDL